MLPVPLWQLTGLVTPSPYCGVNGASLARDGWLSSELTRLQQHQQQQTTRHGAETLCAHADKNAILGAGVLALKTAAQRGMEAVVKCLTCQLTFRVLIPATTWRDHGVLVQKKGKKNKNKKDTCTQKQSAQHHLRDPRDPLTLPHLIGPRQAQTCQPYSLHPLQSKTTRPLPRLSSRARPPV